METDEFLTGGGDMGSRIRAFDWASHPLGIPGSWPVPLRTALRILLTTQHPIFIFWGDDLFCFYNDAYSRSLGPEKHPSTLGARGRDVWPEIWDIIGPQIDQVMRGDGATWHENQLVPILRHGSVEQVYWTYGYGPIDDATRPRGVGGVLVICTETTDFVLSGREQSFQIRLYESIRSKPRTEVFTAALDSIVRHFGVDCAGLFEVRKEGDVDLIEVAMTDAARERGSSFRIAHLLQPEIGRMQRGTALATDGRAALAVPAISNGRAAAILFIEANEARSWTAREMRLLESVTARIWDTAERRRAEHALLERERSFKALADAMPQLVWVCDREGRTEFVNRRMLAYTGGTDDDLLGNVWWVGRIHDEDWDRKQTLWSQSLATGRSYENECRIRGRNGHYRWFLVRGHADTRGDGRIERWYGTCTDIEDAKQVEARLRSTDEMLRESDARKDLFLATLSHELRNPLAPIRNAAKLLTSPRSGPETVARCGEIISRQVAFMASILDDLLDISRITRGALALNRSRISTFELLNHAAEAVQHLIEAKNHRLRIQRPQKDTVLFADPVRLSQILGNLLTNAGKYTNPGGNIELGYRLESDWVILFVCDDGIGLSPEAKSKVFDMFSQVDPTRQQSHDGLGIGLALVKGLVELHDGYIEVRSAGIGLGSEFNVYLPRSTIAEDTRIYSDDHLNSARQTKSQTILIVDDNIDGAETLAEVLRISGHIVHVANNGYDALRLAAEIRPQVALLDLAMPDANGLDVAKRLRSQSWGPSIKLVALTGRGQEQDKAAAFAAGFDSYLTKPVDPDLLATLFEAT